MTIDEAIRIIETMLNISGDPFTPIGKEALRLGIEALKRIKVLRADWSNSPVILLQGETEEVK